MADPAAGVSVVGQQAPTDAYSSDGGQPCKSPRVCLQNQVFTCGSPGTPGRLIETCADVCSLGRCVSVDCALTEASDAARGCLFYGARVDNIDTDADSPTMLLISSASDLSGTISVQARALGDGPPGDTWVTFASGFLGGRAEQRLWFTMPATLRSAGATTAGGFRVVTEHPALVVQLDSANLDRTAQSTAGTVLRPVQSLGFRHRAMTYPQRNSNAVARTPGSRAGAGQVVVVATQDGTVVSLTARVPVIAAHDGSSLQTGGGGGGLPFPLDAGDAFQFFSANEGDDLTGSLLESNQAVAVFSGNVYSSYGAMVAGFNGGDSTLEQLPPVEAWGSEYVGAWLAPQANCDPLGPSNTGRWSVVAAEDGTAVSIAAATGAALEGVSAQFTLGAGESKSFLVHGGTTPDGAALPGDFVLSAAAEKRVLLGQWLDCEPALSWGIDTRHGGDGLSLVLPPGFDHELVVVRERRVEVTLDGAILTTPFSSAGGDGKFEVGRIGSADLGPCRDLLDRCSVTLGSGALGLTWRGMDAVCSYAVTVPPHGTACALPSTQCLE